MPSKEGRHSSKSKDVGKKNVPSKPAGGVMTQRHEEGLGFILSRLRRFWMS